MLLPVLSFDISRDGGGGDQKEIFPFPYHYVKCKSYCDDT